MHRFIIAAAAAILAAGLFTSTIAANVQPQDADLNDDGVVNAADRLIVANPNDPRADANHDGARNSGDGLVVALFYGWPSIMPALGSTPSPIATATGTKTPSTPNPTPRTPSPTPLPPTPILSTTPPLSTATPTRTATALPSTATPTPSSTPTPIPTHTTTVVPMPPTGTPTPSPTATAPSGGGRSKLLQPFSSTSPWNMPIGTGAVYVDAGLPRTNYTTESEYPVLSTTAPLRPLMDNGAWPASCGGGVTVGDVRIPDGYLIEEGSASYMPNNAAAALGADGRTVQEFLYASRCDTTGPVYAGISLCAHDLYGDGGIGRYCAHGGSGLSAVGGSLRAWEVTASGAISHALKVTLPSYLLSNCAGGYRWPAIVADAGHEDPGSWQYYAGSNCDLRMGALLAIPPTADCTALVSSTLARRLCAALRDYGAYVVDVHPSWDAACGCPRTDWRPMTINAEHGAETALDAVGSQLLTLFQELAVVANNSASSIGGGGTPRVPLAPPISD